MGLEVAFGHCLAYSSVARPPVRNPLGRIRRNVPDSRYEGDKDYICSSRGLF